MVPRPVGWMMAGWLLMAAAQAAPAQPVYGQEVLDVPISTRLLLNFREPPLQPCDLAAVPVSTRLLTTLRDAPPPPCYDSAVPMSTLLLQTLHVEPAPPQSAVSLGSVDLRNAGHEWHLLEPSH